MSTVQNYRYAAMLDLTHRLVAVIGGGAVARRKVERLIEAGARVRVVAPRIDPAITDNVEKLYTSYAPHHLDDATLVIACTDDPAVNRQVATDAHTRGLLVNRADDSDDDHPASAGDFVTPATRSVGPVTIAVAAGGAPGVAREILEQCARSIDPTLIILAGLCATLRQRLKSDDSIPPDRRARMLRAATDARAIELFREKGESGWLARVMRVD